MRKLRFCPNDAVSIEQFASQGASAVHLGDGQGEAHAYCVRFDAHGAIGRHPAGFDQLFLAVAGTGWAEDESGQRLALETGEGVVIRKGEVHAKGSETGMTAIMIQLTDWSWVRP